MKAALTTILALLCVNSAWAQSNDKMDIQNLEKKYWSAKDDDFSVVQNRRFTKANRFHLTLFYGNMINDPYAVGSLTSAQVGYYFNERWGLDVSHTTADMKANDTTNRFIDGYGTAPNHAFYKSSTIVSGNFVPLYAKMSFLDSSIIYFDMGFSLGAGTLSYEIQKIDGNETKSTPVFSLGVHQQIFFTEHLAVKVELLNKFSDQEQVKYGNVANRELGKKNINDTSLHLGLNIWY